MQDNAWRQINIGIVIAIPKNNRVVSGPTIEIVKSRTTIENDISSKRDCRRIDHIVVTERDDGQIGNARQKVGIRNPDLVGKIVPENEQGLIGICSRIVIRHDQVDLNAS